VPADNAHDTLVVVVTPPNLPGNATAANSCLSHTLVMSVGNAALSVPQGFSASMDEKPYKCGMYYENQPIKV